MKTEKTVILLNKVKIYAYHGVLPQERLTGAYFYVSLKVEIDFTPAMKNDLLSQTVSYADLFLIIKEQMATPSALLEHAASRILECIFAQHPEVTQSSITLIKENPPMEADCSGAGVEIQASR